MHTIDNTNEYLWHLDELSGYLVVGFFEDTLDSSVFINVFCGPMVVFVIGVLVCRSLVCVICKDQYKNSVIIYK